MFKLGVLEEFKKTILRLKIVILKKQLDIKK